MKRKSAEQATELRQNMEKQIAEQKQKIWEMQTESIKAMNEAKSTLKNGSTTSIDKLQEEINNTIHTSENTHLSKSEVENEFVDMHQNSLEKTDESLRAAKEAAEKAMKEAMNEAMKAISKNGSETTNKNL